MEFIMKQYVLNQVLTYILPSTTTKSWSGSFKKSWNIKCLENSSSGSQVTPCRRTDITKLTSAFHNFVKAPKTSSTE